MKKEYIFTLRNLIALLVSLAIGALIYVFFSFYRGFTFYNSIDGFFVAGSVLVLGGLLFLAGNEGTFDVISVGFANLYSVFKRNGTKKYASLYDYREMKGEKRKGNRYILIPIELAGIVYLIVSIVLFIIYKQTTN